MPQKFNKGPGVYIKEIDQSEVTSPVGTSVGAFVGKANQGPVNRRVFITRDQELIQTFGEPAENLGYALYGALEFLKESEQMYFVRATSGTESYAHVAVTTSGSGVWKTIYANSSTNLLTATGYEDGNKDNDIKDINDYSFNGEVLTFAAIGPGSYGNNLAISIVTCADSVSAGFDWQNKYDTNPLTDIDPIWKKVFKVNVFQKENNVVGFNSVSSAPIETFYASRYSNLVDDNGNNLYVQDVINGISKYIYVRDNSGVTNSTLPGRTAGLVQLLSGADNTSIAAGNIQSAWTLFNDKEKVDVNILVCTDPGDANSNNYATQQVVGNIAASRKDCIALAQVDGTSSTITSVTTITANAGYGYNNPSYVALYAGWDKIYDRFNDRNIFIPKNIYGASIMARTDANGNVWDAPAGKNRGNIPSLEQNVIFNGSQISILRDANINTSKRVIGSGNFMFLQKTALRKESALSDINVRRTLIFIETSISQTLENYIFESNNSRTRLRIKSVLDAFLGQVAAGGGLNTDEDAGFLVVCDTTNNTAQTIANNNLVVDVYVKPIRVIEFISLNMIVTRNGVSFTELVG